MEQYINQTLEYLKEKEVRYIYRISEDAVFNSLVNLKQLVFEVTDACNLQCEYCGYGAFYNTHEKRENKYLSFEVAKQMIDYLHLIWRKHRGTHNNRKIMFGFYGGEPLMNMKLVKQVVEYLEQLPPIPNTEFRYNMTTNAMLLNKNMSYLAEKEFSLLISLDGDEYAQSYRVDHNGANSFQRAIANIQLLKETYPDYFSKHVRFNAVLHDRNNFEGVRNFIFDKFGKYPQVSELNNFGICDSKKEDFKKIFHEIRSDISESDKDFFNKSPEISDLFRFINGVSGNCYFSHNSLLKKSPDNIPPTGTCLPFEKKMFLTVNGNLLPCERIDQKYVLGHVTSEKVNLDLLAIAELYSSFYETTKKICTSCYMKPLCKQCLFYISGLVEGTPVCPGFSDKQSFIQYIGYYCNLLNKRPDLYERISKEILLQL